MKLKRQLTVALVPLAHLIALAACAPATDEPLPTPGVFELPEAYQIEKVADGPSLPSSLAWDDQGQMYVAEAGGGLFPEQLAPIRILRIEDGEATPVIDLPESIEPSMVGLVWHDGAFYFTHRAADLTGAVSRATLDGQVEFVFDGILDSQASTKSTTST